MKKSHSILIAVVCIILQESVTIGAPKSPQKNTDHFGYNTILPTDISGTNVKTLYGGFHKLSANATSNGAANGCINIAGNQTILDLNGASIVASATDQVAIKVAANVNSVTIRNGTILSSGANYFGSAIVISEGVTNVIIEDITIIGCTGGNGTISINGLNNNGIKNVTLTNITITGGTGTIANTNAHIKGSFIEGLHLENIISTGGITSHTDNADLFTGINLQSCNFITGKNITSKNHGPSDTIIGLTLSHCNTIKIDDIYLSKNVSSADYLGEGIYCDGCSNAVFNNVFIDRLINMYSGILIKLSKDVVVNNCTISNCTINSNNNPFHAIYILDSISVKIINTSITNNTGNGQATTSVESDGCSGILGLTSTDIIIDNVEIKSNSAVSGNCDGIILDSTNLVSILNTTIAQNKFTGTATLLSRVRGIFTRTNPENVYIKNCKIIGNVNISTHIASSIAGILLQSVSGATILNTESNQNKGSAQAFGFYIEGIEGLTMQNCMAKGNAAGISGSGHTGGISLKPSAGLYLYRSNGAHVENCKFINNKAGNKNPGLSPAVSSGSASSAIAVNTCCGGFGIANVGNSNSDFNIGNTFINCVFKRNGTQIDGTTLTTNGVSNAAPQYQGAVGAARRCWESEAIEAGAIEENTNNSAYYNCSFESNGLSKFVTSYGLCISNGAASKVENPKIAFCNFVGNGFYGIFDDNPGATVLMAEGSASSNNGNTNSVAVAVQSSETTRNWNVVNGSGIYQSLANNERAAIGVQANDKVNYNFTGNSAA
jgi:hypothetical protein